MSGNASSATPFIAPALAVSRPSALSSSYTSNIDIACNTLKRFTVRPNLKIRDGARCLRPLLPRTLCGNLRYEDSRGPLKLCLDSALWLNMWFQSAL
ncbi:hypothetical protein KOW79_015211 [Hemibagrus wyckioides]|uniref:Uncharacterized protein n=1 Tax=Hemibagrus wyckioides TaxID=337641 RepID=A0A9D3SDW3_9TELE|nr:hypothetical protein KOW79_015211 [Hemibagrus wyckioides]